MVVPITEGFTLGFIGAGKMAEAIAKGVDTSGVLPACRMRTAHHSAVRREAFSSFGVKVLHSNSQVVEESDVIIISVKPQIVKKVVLELKPLLSKEKLLVSIAAGTNLKDLQELAGHGRLIRVMPNTPCLVGMAAAVMSLGEMATKEDEKLIADLFGAVGKIWTANEKLLDAVTGLSGSGPAYIYLAIEAMADGGVAAGLPRDLALCLASQTKLLDIVIGIRVTDSGFSIDGVGIGKAPALADSSRAPLEVLGAAAMAINTGKHPAQLKDEVASPAGTTMAGIRELERGGFRGTLINAVVAAANRSRELSM